MRLFIAIDLPEELSDYCFSMQHKFLKGNGVYNITKHFHCTLRFLGEVKDGEISKITDALSKISFEPFNVTLSRPGVFPDDKTPKVLWRALEKAEKLIILQKLIEQAVSKLDVWEENKPFTPHITLARIKKIYDKNHFRENLKRFEKHEFKINKFILYKSELKNTGPEYTKIEEFTS